MCTDMRCTGGITACMGEAGCNGFGVLTAGGKRYKLRSQGRNIGATAVAHERCHGTGMVVCGCTELAPVELAVITGTVELEAVAA